MQITQISANQATWLNISELLGTKQIDG
jgi:hypothetical protein